MKIIEQFIRGKNADQDICEDGILIKDNIIVVVDGATAKGKECIDNQKSGHFAKEMILKYINENNLENMNCVDFFNSISEFLRKSTKEKNPNLNNIDLPRASVIVYNDIYKEVWNYGDCQCIINNRLYSHQKEIDVLNSNLRAMYLEYSLINGAKISDFYLCDTGREFIKPNLEMQFSFENKDCQYGYPVINGNKINEKMIKIYPVKEGDSIVFASDGYPILKNTLAESEKGLERIINEDPLCFRIYKSTKGLKEGNQSFDDRTYCKFIV